ncbi:uncharacterized protein LOC124285391 [Haliotis rubra]|uniref:uncharacterized protein LOC124285391 n=1 Tax=Haliotis rubra TaxID=36100 RepID=UPI001EE542C3|nr:uncharacterized protein LOC124285391 [Haliotis rubra]XP_046577573.1 uncharacterized protein LOC124285391 [Haliotis rubra]
MPMQWPADEEISGCGSPSSLCLDGSLAVDSPGCSPSERLDSPRQVFTPPIDDPGCMQSMVTDTEGGSYDKDYAHVTTHASSGRLRLDKEKLSIDSFNGNAPSWNIKESRDRGKNSRLLAGTSRTVNARHKGVEIERKDLVPSVQPNTSKCTDNTFQPMQVTNANHCNSVFANFTSKGNLSPDGMKPGVFSVPRTSSGGPCQVCGEKASGNFFGALVCLPCKSFFIRCTKDGEPVFVSQCDGRCDVSKQGRNRCQNCRYKKCLAAGMSRKEKPEAVEPGEGQLLCRVCGDIANGIHFGVYTCEGCKKFFRRGLLEYQSYVCKGAMLCVLNPRNRNNCRYCRYQKCLNVGMSRGAIKMGRPKKLGRDQDDLSKIIANRLPNASVNRNSFCEDREGTGHRLSPLLDDMTIAQTTDRVVPTDGRRRSFSPDSDSSSGSGDGKTADHCQRLSRGSLPLKKCILRSLLTVEESKTVMAGDKKGNGTVVTDSSDGSAIPEHHLLVAPTVQAHVITDSPQMGKSHTTNEMCIEDHVFPNFDAGNVSIVNAANQNMRDVMGFRKMSQQFHQSPHSVPPSPSSPLTFSPLVQTTDSDDQASEPKRRRKDSDSFSYTSSPPDVHMDSSPDIQQYKPSSPDDPINMITEDIPLDLSNSPPETRKSEYMGAVEGSPNTGPHFPVASSGKSSHCWSPASRRHALHVTPVPSSTEVNHNVLGRSHSPNTEVSTSRGETYTEKPSSYNSVKLYEMHVHTSEPSLSQDEVMLNGQGNCSPSAIKQSARVPQSPTDDTTSDAPKRKFYTLDGNVIKELNTFFLGSVNLLKNVRQRLESSNHSSYQTNQKCTSLNSFNRPLNHEAKMKASRDQLKCCYRGLATQTRTLSTRSAPSSHLILPEERHLASKLETEYRFPVDRVCHYWSRVKPSPNEIQMSSAQHKVLQDMLEAYMEILNNLSESHMAPEERFIHLREWPMYEDLAFLEYSVRRILTYVKEELVFMSKVPGFKDLNPEDRNFVVQNMSFANILIIATKEWYNAKTKTFFQMFHLELPEWHPIYFYRKLAFQLAEEVHELKMDRTEAAMVSALNVIAGDCIGLKEPEKIEESRAFLISALRAHISYKGVDPVSRMKEIFSLMPTFRLCSFWNKNIREQICLCKNGVLSKNIWS